MATKQEIDRVEQRGESRGRGKDCVAHGEKMLARGRKVGAQR
jgi:hypothetical protein